MGTVQWKRSPLESVVSFIKTSLLGSIIKLEKSRLEYLVLAEGALHHLKFFDGELAEHVRMDRPDIERLSLATDDTFVKVSVTHGGQEKNYQVFRYFYTDLEGGFSSDPAFIQRVGEITAPFQTLAES